MSFMRLLLLSLAIGAGLGGCRNAADAATEAAIETASGKKVDVERDGDTVTYKTEEGEMTMQGGVDLPLPSDFPKDVYLPKTYAVNSVMDIDRKSTRLNSSHLARSRMPSSA